MTYDGQLYAGGSPNFQEFGPNRGTYTNPSEQQSQPQQPLPNFQEQKPLNQMNQGQTAPQPHNQYQNNSYAHNNAQQTPGAVPMQGGQQQQMQQQAPHPWQQSMNQGQNFQNQLSVLQGNPFFQNKMRKFPGFQQQMQGQPQGSQQFSGGMPQNAGQQPLWGQNPQQFPGNNITTNV
jgi:hypothetical protein